MTKSQLKLVKITANIPEPVLDESGKPVASIVALTPAERTEAARFKALTAVKAARQARVGRMMIRLQDLDEVSSAA
jgi:antitoxin (DNA-binding transcriptional repressor) of toxin-antitoxin stability system